MDDNNYELFGLSDSEIASFVPQIIQNTDMGACSCKGEIDFLRRKICHIEEESFNKNSSANENLCALEAEYERKLAELQAKISLLETENALAVLTVFYQRRVGIN